MSRRNAVTDEGKLLYAQFYFKNNRPFAFVKRYFDLRAILQRFQQLFTLTCGICLCCKGNEHMKNKLLEGLYDRFYIPMPLFTKDEKSDICNKKEAVKTLDLR